jgi:polysaccharide biosynthesis transport protein
MQDTGPDIRAKLEPFRRRWLLMAVVVVAVSAATYKYYSGKPETYTATTSVFVRPGGYVAIVGSDSEVDPQRNLANAAELLDTPAVAQRVAETLGYKGNPDALLSQVTVAPSSGSDFLAITATDANPVRAAAIANGFADAFAALSTRPGARRAVPGVQSVQRATVPTSGTATSPRKAAVFAAILGLVLAVLLVRGLEVFDRRLRHTGVADDYDLPLLGSVPLSRERRRAVWAGARPPAAVMEQFRGLRTMLDHTVESAPGSQSILITSAIPGEGKSTLVNGLALSYYQSGRSVLMVDCDLRQPTLHELFEAPLAPGLTDVVRGTLPMTEAIQEIQPNDVEPALESVIAGFAMVGGDGAASRPDGGWSAIAGSGEAPAAVVHLLTSGSGTSDPSAVLGSAQLSALLEEAKARYDMVLIDSPPVLAVSDPIALASAVDGVLIVARTEYTARDAAERCRKALERVPGVTLLGVVANAVRDKGRYSHQYYTTAGD